MERSRYVTRPLLSTSRDRNSCVVFRPGLATEEGVVAVVVVLVPVVVVVVVVVVDGRARPHFSRPESKMTHSAANSRHSLSAAASAPPGQATVQSLVMAHAASPVDPSQYVSHRSSHCPVGHWSSHSKTPMVVVVVVDVVVVDVAVLVVVVTVVVVVVAVVVVSVVVVRVIVVMVVVVVVVMVVVVAGAGS